jgi:hypothetical protein
MASIANKDQLPFPFYLGIAGKGSLMGICPWIDIIEIVDHFLVFCRSHDMKWGEMRNRVKKEEMDDSQEGNG